MVHFEPAIGRFFNFAIQMIKIFLVIKKQSQEHLLVRWLS